jgi:hypothetical protein
MDYMRPAANYAAVIVQFYTDTGERALVRLGLPDAQWI